ncbi:MAG: hypothetical protein WD768_01635 [Phycisphaeraceae bacterium]
MAERDVIGKLGVPLGTVVEIQATIIAGRELRMKAYDGLYLLKVTHVGARLLEEPPVLEFSVPGFIDVELPSDHRSLVEMIKREEEKHPGRAKTNDIEKGFVGRTVKLVVHEVGTFSGLPRNRPNDVPVWADRGFSLRTSLEVLAQRK